MYLYSLCYSPTLYILWLFHSPQTDVIIDYHTYSKVSPLAPVNRPSNHIECHTYSIPICSPWLRFSSDVAFWTPWCHSTSWALWFPLHWHWPKSTHPGTTTLTRLSSLSCCSTRQSNQTDTRLIPGWYPWLIPQIPLLTSWAFRLPQLQGAYGRLLKSQSFFHSVKQLFHFNFTKML